MGTEAKPEETIAEAEQPARRDAGSLDLVIDVPLRLTVEMGSTRMPLREVLQLGKGAVVELDRASGEPADVLVNGRLIARGDVTVVDERLAVRIVEVLQAGAREADLG